MSRVGDSLRRLQHRLRLPSDERITDSLPGLCKFLKSRQEVERCTAFLRRNGYVSHSLRCKDWDLAHIVPDIGDGAVLDMGSSDSYLLKNLSYRRRHGQLVGIDLRQPDVPVSGARYVVGDLMDTGFPAASFRYVTCLSVLEHQVDFVRFAAETSRLLADGGRLYVTFDYWEPRVATRGKLYGLDWQPLDTAATLALRAACAAHGLRMAAEMDWTLGDPVIDEDYYSPQAGVRYTFGLAAFDKAAR